MYFIEWIIWWNLKKKNMSLWLQQQNSIQKRTITESTTRIQSQRSEVIPCVHRGGRCDFGGVCLFGGWCDGGCRHSFFRWFAGHHPPLLSIVDALVSSSFCILLVAVGSFVANEWTTTRRTINGSLCTSLSETIEQRLLLTRLGARMIIETWTQVNVIRYGMRRRNPISMNVGRT